MLITECAILQIEQVMLKLREFPSPKPIVLRTTKVNGAQNRGTVRWVLFDSVAAGSKGIGGAEIRYKYCAPPVGYNCCGVHHEINGTETTVHGSEPDLGH